MGISSCVKACWDVKGWCTWHDGGYRFLKHLDHLGSQLWGIRHAQLTQRKMCKSMPTLLILANFFISDYCKRFCIQSRIVMLFLSRHCSSLPDERFVNLRFQASSDDDNRSPFQLSLVHAIFPEMFPSLNDSESDNETISISWQNVLRWWMAQMRKDSWDDSLPLNTITCLLRSFRCYAYSFAALHCFSQSRFISGTTAPAGPVWRSLSSQMKIAKAKALDHVDGLLRRRWRVNEKHGACRCESSSGLLPTNWIQSLFLSLRMDGATVICSCIGRYHTIPYSWSAAKKAQGSQRCRRRWSGGVKRLSACSLPGYADDAIRIYWKRYNEVPKTITLTKNRIFQLRFCWSLIYNIGYLIL